MKDEPSLNPVEFDPNLLLDGLRQKYRLKNDAALSRYLQVTPSVISRLRCRKSQITCAVLICIHESTGLSIRELRAMMGDNRPFCLLGKNHVSGRAARTKNSLDE